MLGRTYEYCIAQFAEKEGVGGGEFYTPSSVVKKLWFPSCVRLITAECTIAAVVPAVCLYRVKSSLKHMVDKRGAISVYGQEANPDTWKMAKMNMAIRGIDADLGTVSMRIHLQVTCTRHLKADFILANPPFNLSSVGTGKTEGR